MYLLESDRTIPGRSISFREKIMVSVELFLFLNADASIKANKKGQPKPADIAKTGEVLKDRLSAAANALEKLYADGWEAVMEHSGVLLSHDEVETAKQAKARIKTLGLSQKLFNVTDI